MGSGKSQSARHLMRTPNRKFIYISPYVTDGSGIVEDCPEQNFVLPAHLPTFNFSKRDHCKDLLRRSVNVACTHELFKRYDDEMLEIIREQHYTLVVDEEVAVMEECKIHNDDLNLLLTAGLLEMDEDENLHKTERGDAYRGNSFREFMETLERRNLYACGNEENQKYFFWQLPPDLLQAFDDVYILTYMFECQDIRYMLDINGMEYQYIYIERFDGDQYRFVDNPAYIPAYVSHISEMIDIYEGDNLNAVGTPMKPREYPLSKGWMQHNPKGVENVRKNLANYFTNYAKGVPSSEKMWSTYTGKTQEALSRRGYAQGFIPFNKRGSNEYRNKKWLAYCVNIYVSPQAKNYYSKHGITADEDKRALSTMIQWIWRSAIRDGKPIHIYIPSERMRNLLKDWISQIEADAASGRWAQHGQQYENGIVATDSIDAQRVNPSDYPSPIGALAS